MRDLDLDAIEARANAASDEPWIVVHESAWEADDVQHPDVIKVGAPLYVGDDEPVTVCLVSTDYEDDPVDVLGDAEFIAHARTDVPALVAEVRRLREGGPGPLGLDAIDPRKATPGQVADLIALVRAKESWIDGAKVDMAAMEEELAKALAAIALAGEEIERASVEVKRADRQRDDARAAIARVRALCAEADDGEYTSVFAAAILAALDVRHDPSATTDGGGSDD